VQNDGTPEEEGGSSAEDTEMLPADASSAEPPQSPARFDFWIPAMMLILGLILGGGLVWLVTMDGSDDASEVADNTATSAAPTVTTTSTTTDLEVTVPAECLDLADNTQQILDLIDEAVAAAADLDAGALSEVVSELEAAQADLETQSQACEDAANSSN
jgi:hypothetical protein